MHMWRRPSGCLRCVWTEQLWVLPTVNLSVNCRPSLSPLSLSQITTQRLSWTDPSCPTLPRVHLCLYTQHARIVSIFLFPVNTQSELIWEVCPFPACWLPFWNKLKFIQAWSINPFPSGRCFSAPIWDCQMHLLVYEVNEKGNRNVKS